VSLVRGAEFPASVLQALEGLGAWAWQGANGSWKKSKVSIMVMTGVSRGDGVMQSLMRKRGRMRL
jgi:hypothetical protein